MPYKKNSPPPHNAGGFSLSYPAVLPLTGILPLTGLPDCQYFYFKLIGF
jgi:hypothetical protein